MIPPSFRSDTRGVTAVVGAILVLGFLVISISIFQASVVPEENEGVEYRHNLEVQEDMKQVRGAILQAGTSTDIRTTMVKLGTTYPTRVLFVNPPPATGRLATTTASEVRVTNAKATVPQTRDYINDSSPYSHETRNVSYDPRYTVYRNAPTTRYEHTVLINRFEGRNSTTVNGQQLVQGQRIYLVAVRGNLSQQGVRSETVDPTSLSTQTETVPLEGTGPGANVTVSFRSSLSASRWATLLENTGEYDPDTSTPTDEQYVHDVRESGGRVVIEFENATAPYALRTAKVGIGTGATTPDATYLTNVTSTQPTDAREPLTAEVRDRFNNPVGDGAVVAVTTTGGVTLLDGTTNRSVGVDGRVSANIDINASDSGTVEFRLLNTSPATTAPMRNVTFEITSTALQRAGGAGAGGGKGKGVGTGGESDYSQVTDRTISTEGGIWTNVTGVNEINLSDPRLAATTAKDAQLKENQRHLRISFQMTNGSTTYHFVFNDQSGKIIQLSNDNKPPKINSVKVYVYKQENKRNVTKVIDGIELTSGSIRDFVLNNESLALLQTSSYKTSTIRPDLNEIRRFLNDTSDPNEFYFTNVHGRVEVNLNKD